MARRSRVPIQPSRSTSLASNSSYPPPHTNMGASTASQLSRWRSPPDGWRASCSAGIELVAHECVGWVEAKARSFLRAFAETHQPARSWTKAFVRNTDLARSEVSRYARLNQPVDRSLFETARFIEPYDKTLGSDEISRFKLSRRSCCPNEEMSGDHEYSIN